MLVDLLDRPIAYHRVYRSITGSTVAAVMLSQLAYWQGIVDQGGGGVNGWIHKTIDEIEKETGLSRQEQITARKVLKKLKILNEKKEGLPRKLFFQVNFEVLENFLMQYQSVKPKKRKVKPRQGKLEKQYLDAAVAAANPNDPAAYSAIIRKRLASQGGLTDADRGQLRQWEQARPVPKIRSGDLIDFGTYRQKIREIRGSCIVVENGKVLPIGPIIDDIRKGKVKLISFSC